MKRETMLTEKQKQLFDYLKMNADGVTANDVRHLFEGDVGPARTALKKLVDKKMVKKKIIKEPREVMGVGTAKIKIAVFYPLEDQHDHRV